MAQTVHGKSPRTRRAGTMATSAAVVGGTIPPEFPATCLGVIAAISPEGVPQVSIAGGAPVVAMILGQVSSEHLTMALVNGSSVLLTFIDGDRERPVIVGVVAASAVSPRRAATATVDGRRVELTGQNEVVLKCGKASITLTKEGRIILRGSYIASASTGLNRITGGSVQIN